MTALRPPSARPTLATDERGAALVDTGAGQIGLDGPITRERVLLTLPLKNGPRQLAGSTVFHDTDTSYLADTANQLIGFDTVLWVHRLLTATVTWDTRRL